jgi:hypothetical protein
MKVESVAEVMISVFTAIVAVLPPDRQQIINSILSTALSEIEDADAVRVLECLVEPSADEAASRLYQ